MILRGKHYLNSEVYDFVLEEGKILEITPTAHQEYMGGEGFWIAPGLIDIQVNGYLGINFSSSSNTPNDIETIAKDLLTAGVTAFCPTIITDSHEVIIKSVRSIVAALNKFPKLRKQIVAIHLEGPYISAEEGPRGAHPLDYVKSPDWDEFVQFQNAAEGLIRIITLAPELPGALDFIRRATNMGVVVAIGHHAANREQIKAAIGVGAVLSTHLGNGSHDLVQRHHNYIWEQLADDALAASIIVDGHHLPQAVVKTFFRTKGSNRLILTSDVVSSAGLPPGKHIWMGKEIEVGVDGSIRLAGTPYLAGSAVKLCDSIGKMIDFSGASFSEAIQMASENPARLLGIETEYGILRVGKPANIAVFRDTPHYDLAYTILEGEICYENEDPSNHKA